jgi:undecaprenyl-diphosphatase
MRGLVLVNPASGPEDTSVSDVRELFPEAEVVEVDHDRLQDQLAEHLHPERPYVAVVGGDGTIRSVAGAVVERHGPPLLPVPAGTRNHFARAVGVPEMDDAAWAARSGEVIRVDVAEVNGHWFVNNSSLGVYPHAVATRERLERRLPKAVAQWLAAWHQLRGGEAFPVRVGDRSYRAWLVFVGNGAYGDDLRDIASRDTLTANQLDVRVVRADLRLSRLRLLGAIVSGRLARTPVVVTRCCPEIEIDVDRSRVKVALDGEVDDLASPLRYRSCALALPVLVPPPDGGGVS